MNTLTALRTFGNPSLTPTKGTKIFNDRWYLVTMQNTERDMGDGYYLAEGEYTELLPGKAARERREARLNHCNRIAEYNGPVFELFANEYGGEMRSFGFFPSVAALNAKLDERKAAFDKWLAALLKDAATVEASALAADKNPNAVGTFVDGRYTGGEMNGDCYRTRVAEIMACYEAHKNGFRADFKVTR